MEEEEQEAVRKSVSLLWGGVDMDVLERGRGLTDGRTSTSPFPADRCDRGVRSGGWICRWRP